MKEVARKLCSLIAIVVVVIAGCAPASQQAAPAQTPKAPAAPATKPAESPKEAAKLPKRGGTFVFTGAATTDPVGFAPTTVGGHSGQSVWNMISCNLVKWDHRPGHPLAATELMPDLAESWENSTPTKYTFQLRKGAKTQTGKEVTAQDVKWHLDMLYEKQKSTINTQYGQINPAKDIEIPDPYTIIFNLPKPDVDFLNGQAGSYTRIYFNTKAEPTEDSAWKKWGGWYSGLSNVDGCGAWKGVGYQTASHIIFERRNDYWEMGKDGKSLPYLDRVEHRYIFDPSAQIAALRAGQVMAIPEFAQLDLDLIDQVARDSPGIVVQYLPGARILHHDFDLWAPPFNDVRVRRAMMMALDWDKWIQSQFKGRAKKLYGMVASLGDWALDIDKMDPNKEGKWWHYNPQEAKKLLAEAGYTNGFEFNFTRSTGQLNQAGLEIMTGMLRKELDIKMNIVLMDYAVQGIRPNSMASGFSVRSDLKSYVWSYQYPGVRTSNAYGDNRPYYPRDMANVKEYTALIEKQQATLDLAERKKLVHEMQRMGADNIWKFYIPVEENGRMRYPYVKDWELYMGWTWGELIYTWLDK